MFPYVVHAKSIVQARGKAVNLIMNQGKIKRDERGEKVKYLKHVIIVIPCDCCEDSEELFSYLCGFAFGKNLITGEPVCFGECVGSKKQEPDYTYGQELHKNNGLEETIQKLKQFPNSRRVVNPLFKTEHYGKDEVPCMITLVWDIEDVEDEDCLNLTIFGRSNEAAIAMKNDIKGFSYLLEYVAFRIGVKPGLILLHDVNLHCRINSDMDEIKRILKEGY